MAERNLVPKPRGLRFDKVALRFIGQVQAMLHDGIPESKTVLVAISAPIRLPAKTAAELEARLRTWLAAPPKPDFRATINGNHVRARVVNGRSSGSANLLGFVHNSDVDSASLLQWADADRGAGSAS